MFITSNFKTNIAPSLRFENQKSSDGNFYPQRGILVAENKKSVSFTSLQSTLDYIAKARFINPQITLQKLDPNKIADICEGLPVFKGWTAKTLQLITSCFDGILLQRGCIHKCSHCGADAENKITTMSWDNFTALVDDIEILTKRLGYNPFSLAPIDKRAYFFFDSDPMIYKSKGKDGIFHNIYDAAQYHYEKTGTKMMLTTAGWPEGNKTAKNAAKSFTKNPEVLGSFSISVHPFHDYVQRSIETTKNGNSEKATYWRNKYVNMMANTIKSTIELKDKIQIYAVALEYDDVYIDSATGLGNAEKLLNEICTKLAHDKIDTSFLTRGIYSRARTPENFIKFPIGHIGRGVKYAEYRVRCKPTIIEALSSNNTKIFVKSIAPDGKILIRPHYEQEEVGGDFYELPFSLNFPLSTKDNSKRPPLPKLEIID